jgi:hypothetical protein
MDPCGSDETAEVVDLTRSLNAMPPIARFESLRPGTTAASELASSVARSAVRESK